ncbi:hypothetical protein FRUB_06533 [Fimbriiglobus ruber]|uniref:Uncharacterized protein n=1 Tax=Fimbriiglobus ruber TaxID=1908690 RepID=A0A225D8W6_9BACT|nr:hypothetical protein FRUB_06533 [Fimbriiglobus ruber]
MGGQLCTSVEALQRFFDRQTRTDNPRPVPKPMPADRNQVERELAALGL